MTGLGIVDAVLSWAVANPERAAGAVTALTATLAHYQKTGSLPLGRFPLRTARKGLQELTDRYFGRKRPKGVPAVVVDATPDEVATTLRDHHFESADLTSYQYADEAWSYRRPEGTRSHPDTGAPVPVELHPRGFRTEDGETLVPAHSEASRYEETDAHLDGVLLSWDRGREAMMEVLDDADLDYQLVESERAADITVEPPQ